MSDTIGGSEACCQAERLDSNRAPFKVFEAEKAFKIVGFMEHTDNALCTSQSVQRILVDKGALKFNIRLQNLFNRVLVQPTGAVGAACDGWLPGRGRFPPIGGRRGNTAATTLAAAADSRLTSFSL